MKSPLIKITLLAGVLAFMAGCMRMGPEYKTPEPPAPLPASYQHSPKKPKPYEHQDHWWETFGDQRLNRLVDKAFAHNWDIKLAAARVLELQAQFTETRSSRFPRLDLNANTDKTQTIQIAYADRRTESYDLTMAASFEVDLWGKLARAEEAARADLLGAEENQRTITQTVVAEVVSAYLQVESLERRLQVNLNSQESYQRNLQFVENRYRRGLSSILDLRQARRALASERAKEPQLRQELGQAQQALAILTGDYPKTTAARRQPQDYFPNLEPVPAGLPSELLLRRPDLRQSQASLKALYARVGVAQAARFPTIKLTAGFGYSSDALGSLTSPGSELWSLAGGLTQPLFDAGLLKARQRAAEARLKQGLASYASSVLKAFKEVEGALLVRRQQLERRQLLKETLREAIATEEAAKHRYIRGLTDYLRVLEAQYTRYQVEDSLILSELALLTNRVTLHRALGGGWDRSLPASAAHSVKK